jgi:flavin-dependent dehydrogenase
LIKLKISEFMEEYDVIVAGAGPAGGNCAKELAETGYDVLLLERSKIIGEPNFSSGGTLTEKNYR